MEENNPQNRENTQTDPNTAQNNSQPKDASVSANKTPLNEKIVLREIEDEMKKSYLDYSMSVIVGRALPDIRDGLKPVHRRVLFSMHELGLMHNKAFKKSARIVGECFVKDTLILTDNGLIPIQEIKNGDIVFTQKDKCKVTELYEMPEQELLKIKLKNGITNTVTKSQKFKVLTSQLGFEWKEAKDLKEDEYVVIKAEYPDITAYVPLGEINSRKICLNENIAYLIGQLLSDGWVEKGYNHGKGFRCCFSSSSYSVMAKVAMILEHEFGHSATIEIKDHEILSTTGQMLLSRMYNVRINKTIINELFTDVFKLKSANAYTKTIPLQFFTSPKPVIFSLISGMIDGDGSIHKDRLVIHYGSVSETMINQFQLLLQHLGIFSTKYSDTNMKEGTINGKTIYPNYAFHSLEIVGSFAQKLAKSLNLYEEKKAERIKSQLISEDVKASHYDEIPYAGKIIFEELSNSHIGSGWYKDAAMNKFRLGIKYPGGSKIRYSSDLKDKMLTRTQIISWNIQKKLNMLGSSLAKFINHILDDNVYFLQIEKIEKTLAEKTYDIQVENEHEFIANGVVSHNCLGKYHPHGDVAVYDSLVRIAQNFSLRYPLVDGQGNFGSQDGDNPAAQRYTEARLSKIAAEMLADIEKETVKFQPNFDASLDEPTVLPAKIPNLLINGSSGIAVGMATNIPPHNLHEVIDGVIRAIDNPEISAEELMGSIIAPDFPTGGIICGRQGIINAYKYGRGKIIIRARTQIEEKKKRQRIIITEIPYMVNKSLLIEHIADLIRDKKVNGISDIRDESDRDGMRIVIELKTDANSDVVINQLYKHSNLQTTFGVIMLALVNNIPKILTLKEMITNYIEYRKEIVTNRTKFELKKAQERVHILSGLIIALNDIDNIIRKIKASKDTQAATAVLIADFALSELQAKAILDMKLQRLASLEQQKIKDEYAELLKLISELESILASSQKLMGIIKKELHEISEKYSDKRKTQVADITLEESELDVEDLIVKEDMVITVTNAGYIKRTPVKLYKEQRRGGKGIIAATTKEEDFVSAVFTASTHSYILFFTNKGRVYWLKTYEIPESSRQAKGKPIINLIQFAQDEKINAFIPVNEFDDKHYLILATKQGVVKKTNLIEYSNPRTTGIIAVNLDENDELINAELTDGSRDVILATKNGHAVRFNEEDARAIGRTGRGVRGINLRDSDEVISMVIASNEKFLLTMTENGFGKRTSMAEYHTISRGGLGVINIQCTERNGKVVAVKSVYEDNDLMLISKNGITIRMSVSGISCIGRNTQGVTLMKLEQSDKVVAAAVIVKEDEVENTANNLENNNTTVKNNPAVQTDNPQVQEQTIIQQTASNN